MRRGSHRVLTGSGSQSQLTSFGQVFIMLFEALCDHSPHAAGLTASAKCTCGSTDSCDAEAWIVWPETEDCSDILSAALVPRLQCTNCALSATWHRILPACRLRCPQLVSYLGILGWQTPSDESPAFFQCVGRGTLQFFSSGRRAAGQCNLPGADPAALNGSWACTLRGSSTS